MSIWKNINNIEPVKSPSKLLNEQSKDLEIATNFKVYCKAERVDCIGLDFFNRPGYMKSCNFIYEFNLRGKYLKNYKFNVFTLLHDIDLYPAYIVLDTSSYRKIFNEDATKTQIIKSENEKDLIENLEIILGSQYISKIIGSIVSLSE